MISTHVVVDRARGWRACGVLAYAAVFPPYRAEVLTREPPTQSRSHPALGQANGRSGGAPPSRNRCAAVVACLPPKCGQSGAALGGTKFVFQGTGLVRSGCADLCSGSLMASIRSRGGG